MKRNSRNVVNATSPHQLQKLKPSSPSNYTLKYVLIFSTIANHHAKNWTTKYVQEFGKCILLQYHMKNVSSCVASKDIFKAQPLPYSIQFYIRWLVDDRQVWNIARKKLNAILAWLLANFGPYFWTEICKLRTWYMEWTCNYLRTILQ